MYWSNRIYCAMAEHNHTKVVWHKTVCHSLQLSYRSHHLHTMRINLAFPGRIDTVGSNIIHLSYFRCTSTSYDALLIAKLLSAGKHELKEILNKVLLHSKQSLNEKFWVFFSLKSWTSFFVTDISGCSLISSRVLLV